MPSDLTFERLFSPFNLGEVTLRNRIVFLPHYTAMATRDSLPSEREVQYYAERARGGAGLIIAGNYAVSVSGQMHATFVNASDPRVIPNFTRTVRLVHGHGAKIFGQLTHAGPTKMEKPQPDLWAPSQVIEGSSGTHTMEVGQAEIDEIVSSFQVSAVHLQRSGFDGVEIKVGHDGILRAFLSPHYNKRTDRYGGSLENCARLLVEVLTAVRAALAPRKVLGIRLCMDEFEADGYRLDYALKVAKYLEGLRLIDYVSVDAGTTWLSYIMQIPPMTVPLGFAEYMGAELKREVKLPVIAFGRINDPVQAEQILANGNADLIGMVRQLICDPETPNKSRRGDVDGIRKCIACEDGCCGQGVQFQPIRCIQNPAVGREKQLGIGTLEPARRKKRLLIVGGGVAGMKTAEIAAKRGHTVVLFEKEAALGGQLNFVKKVPFRNEFSEVIRFLEFQLKGLPNVQVRMNAEATEQAVVAESPDAVVIAAGSTRYVPDQWAGPRVFTSWDILGGGVDAGREVVVFDMLAKDEGLGVAEYISEYFEGARIRFFTPAHSPGADVHFLNQDVLFRKLYARDFTAFPFHELRQVTNDTIVFTQRYARKDVVVEGYDTLVVVGPMRSNDALYKGLAGKVPELFRVGDARAPRVVELAVRGAEMLARAL
jgi:2,4-dienoyl-CoA reductase-like NADH-dependent reductase (Old Yellow Enzyme family)